MSLKRVRDYRERIHKFIQKDHDMHGSMNNLWRIIEKIFQNEKEMEDAISRSKHTTSRSEHKDLKKKYYLAKKGRNKEVKNYKKTRRKVLEKFKKLKKAAKF